MAGEFLKTMKEYPPSQSPGSFNLTKIQKQLEGGPEPVGAPGSESGTQKGQSNPEK